MSPAGVRRVQDDGFEAYELAAPGGELRATVIPALAMLGVSLAHRDQELLGRRGGVRAYAERGSTMGIPLLYPWANRLSDLSAAGLGVDASSGLVRIDGSTGLPIHGLNLRGAPWRLTRAGAAGACAEVAASLTFDADEDLGRAYPYPHMLEVAYRLGDAGLEIITSITPTGSVPVPVSFGFHPYFALPGAARARWELSAAVAERIELDARLLPTGLREPAGDIDGPLGGRTFDDAFSLAPPPAELALVGGGRRVGVTLGSAFPFAQIFAPADQDLIALEPMTAPTDALVGGGADLRHVGSGETLSATFSITVR